MDGLPLNISRTTGQSGIAGALASEQVARRQRARQAAVKRNAEPLPIDSESDAVDAPVDGIAQTGPTATAPDAPPKDQTAHIDVRA